MQTRDSTATDYILERVLTLATATPSPAVDRRVRHIILDHIGCALMGSKLPHAQPAFAAFAGMRGAGPPDATCVDGRRGPVFVTAYLNGTSANALDFDDTLYGHPGAAIVAAAIAAGERGHATLGDLLRAVIAAYQIRCLLSRAGLPTRERASLVRSGSAYDAIAAAVATVAVSGPSRERLSAAVSVAAAQSLVPFVGKWYERPVPGVKNNLGWCASAGVLAVDLADAGATGVTRPLEGPRGFWLMTGSDRWDWDGAVLKDQSLAVMQVGFKPYPACWHLQHHLSALQRLLADVSDCDNIDSIALVGGSDLSKFVEAAAPGSAEVAFSARTLCGLLVSGIMPGPQWADRDTVESVKCFAERVRVVTDAEPRVVVAMRGGRTLVEKVVIPDYDDPHTGGLDEAGVRDKFRRGATMILPSHRVERILEDLVGASGDTELVAITRSLVR